MKIYNVTEQAILESAESAQVQIENFRPLNKGKTAFALVLRPLPKTRDKETGFCKWQRVSGSYFHVGRKVWAVCYHGHKEFLSQLFDREPACRVVSSMATFDGQEDFTRNRWEVAKKNVGSLYYPVSYGEACYCD